LTKFPPWLWRHRSVGKQRRQAVKSNERGASTNWNS